MTPDDLLLRIRQIFGDIPRPSRTMADAEVEDDRSEVSRFEEHDAHWWEVPADLLRRCSAPFSFLEAQNFAYYLPAYMSWFLKTSGGADSFSSESLLYYFPTLTAEASLPNVWISASAARSESFSSTRKRAPTAGRSKNMPNLRWQTYGTQNNSVTLDAGAQFCLNARHRQTPCE